MNGDRIDTAEYASDEAMYAMMVAEADADYRRACEREHKVRDAARRVLSTRYAAMMATASLYAGAGITPWGRWQLRRLRKRFRHAVRILHDVA